MNRCSTWHGFTRIFRPAIFFLVAFEIIIQIPIIFRISNIENILVKYEVEWNDIERNQFYHIPNDLNSAGLVLIVTGKINERILHGKYYTTQVLPRTYHIVYSVEEHFCRFLIPEWICCLLFSWVSCNHFSANLSASYNQQRPRDVSGFLFWSPGGVLSLGASLIRNSWSLDS